jgi:hypothetical protein
VLGGIELSAETMDRHRRMIVLGLGGLCAAGSAVGQSRRLAALSLVGDKIEVVYARPETGSHMNHNSRRAFDDAEGTLDRFVLQAVDRAVRRSQPGAALAMLALPGTALYEQPERAFDGRQVALPGPAVDAIVASKASHLLLLTKFRDAAQAPLHDSTVGVGTVRGLGFYVDNDIRLQLRDTGATAAGLLAPFVYVRISLVDVDSGEVLREELVRAMETHSTAENRQATVPWDVLSAQQKIEALHNLIERSIGDATAKLLRAG